jgi:hypothetical protein
MAAHLLEDTAVCSTVHTPTTGRSPVARHSATRGAVHTTARGGRADGNSTHRAGFWVISPRRIAPFNAARSTSRTRCSVAGDSELDRSRAVNIACAVPMVNSRNITPLSLAP